MIRHSKLYGFRNPCWPRTSGDDPVLSAANECVPMLAPHERG